MKNPDDPRHTARILVLQKLFLEDFQKIEKTSSEDFTVEQFMHADEIDSYDKELYEQILNGVKENIEQTNQIITKYAPQWPLEQIKKVDLQILRISIYEGFIGKHTPPKVAIDEGIELAKEFGGNSSDKFVNGVLGAIYEKEKVSKEN